MAYAKFKAHKFSYLNITNIGSDFVLKGSECGLACVNIPSCFSFNLAVFSDIMNGKILCELLPSDVFNNSKNIVASKFHHHYSITVSETWTLKKLNMDFSMFLLSQLSPFWNPVFLFKLLKQLGPISREKQKEEKGKRNRNRRKIRGHFKELGAS